MKTILKINVFSLIVIMMLIQLPQLAVAQNNTISIASLDINASITPLEIRQMSHGTTWDTSRLVQEVGYFTGTGWFGQGTNIVLGGHSELAERQPDVFYNLDEIQLGDVISVHADGNDYNYVVTSIETVSPSNLNSILPTGFEQLTLITCDTNSFDGATYQQRLIIRARPIELT